MILNRIRWWGFNPETQGNVEYPFIAITPRLHLTWISSTFKDHLPKNRSLQKLLILDRNAWNHITECKQMIIISKVGDHSQGQAEGSLLNSYYTEV